MARGHWEEPPVIAVVGPTAVGKTSVGVILAQRLDGEIVSADAVAVYRGLDIGAAKPTRAEREAIPFHLVDVAAPDEDFTLADFERMADAAIADIRARGKTPIVVGGTGLYVRAITSRLTMPYVPPQADIRKRLWAVVEEQGAGALHERLAAVDPAASEKIAAGDAKRTIRALEVYEVTGRPISSFHTPEGVQGIPRPNTFIFGLNRDRETLYARIEQRVDTMMAAGFLDEVRGLILAGYPVTLKSMQSLGYRHLAAHLEAGIPLETAVENLKRDTRRFAKRQISWFSADTRLRWVEVASEPMTEAAADILERSLNEAILSSAGQKEIIE